MVNFIPYNTHKGLKKIVRNTNKAIILGHKIEVECKDTNSIIDIHIGLAECNNGVLLLLGLGHEYLGFSIEYGDWHDSNGKKFNRKIIIKLWVTDGSNKPTTPTEITKDQKLTTD